MYVHIAFKLLGHSMSNHPMDYTTPSQILMKLSEHVDLNPTALILKF